MSLALILMSGLVPLALLMMGLIVSKVSDNATASLSAFECGFEEFVSARLSFSLKFFLIVLVFLVFDVEIALLLPIPISAHMDPYFWVKGVSLMITILLYGLYLEMKQGSLSWVE